MSDISKNIPFTGNVKNLINYFQILLVIVCFLSCDEKGDNGIGPCVHTFREPVLHITSVRDTINYSNLKFVKLRDLRINGSSLYSKYAIIESYSVISDDSTFYCNVPFGFGNIEGKYEFIIEAVGYQPKHITIENVNYSVYKGGCPSYNDGGKRIELIIN